VPERRGQFLVPTILVTALFFLWGIPNNLNDVLIRQFMKSFAITRMQAGLVQSAFYLGYFVLAVPSALYMRRLGYKAGFVTGLTLFGVGAFMFWPAALVARYWIFLLSLFVMASGLAFLETASNTFIALCGPAKSAERRLNFAQAFNPLGSISGVLIGTIFIFSGVELSAAQASQTYLHSEILRVVRPYIVLGIIALGWALLILLSPFPRLRDEQPDQLPMPAALLLRQKSLIASIVAQFFYVGAQVGTWSYFIGYVQDYSGRGEKVGGYFLTGTLCMFAGGRFISAWLMKFMAPAKLMAVYAAVNFLLVGVGVFMPGWIGIWAIFLTSFFMSLMYPTIFALGIEGLGSSSKVGGSLLVMAIIGGAVLTPLMGIIADQSKHLAWAYTVPLAAYCIIAVYSLTKGPRAYG
jgi:FHS family L-fucose permease-like MFS transporter